MNENDIQLQLEHRLRMVTARLAEAQDAYDRVDADRRRLQAQVDDLLEQVNGMKGQSK